MKRYWKNNFFLMLLVLSSTLVNTSAYSQMERLSEVFGIEELGQFSSSDPSSVKEDVLPEYINQEELDTLQKLKEERITEMIKSCLLYTSPSPRD